MPNHLVSIIIPFKKANSYINECLKYCLSLNYPNFEIILLPDESLGPELRFNSEKIKVIPTGPVLPSAKRNLAIKNSQADVLAFIDDDAYPISADWLNLALKYFKDGNVGVVGGPNLTPPDDSLMQKASGEIFSSVIGSGATSLRYFARNKFRPGLPVKEMPSCNLFVWRSLAEAVGGFDEKFLTGEDSKFCFKIRKLGKKIINAPDVLVYHHRRRLFWSHFKQVWIYGRDKAWLAKEDFSLDKIYYFIPFLFVVGLLGGLIFWPILWLRLIYLIIILLYLIGIFLASLTKGLLAPLVFIGIIFTHLVYGLGFFSGLIRKHN